MPSTPTKLDRARAQIESLPDLYDPDNFFPKYLRLIEPSYSSSDRTAYNVRACWAEAELWIQTKLCSGIHPQVIEHALSLEFYKTEEGHFQMFLVFCIMVMVKLEASGEMGNVPSFERWIKYPEDRKCEVEIAMLEMFGDGEIFRGLCRDRQILETLSMHPALSELMESVLGWIQMEIGEFIKERFAWVQNKCDQIAAVKRPLDDSPDFVIINNPDPFQAQQLSSQQYGNPFTSPPRFDRRQLPLPVTMLRNNRDPYNCSPKPGRKRRGPSNNNAFSHTQQPRPNFNSKFEGSRTSFIDPRTGEYIIPPPKMRRLE